MLELNSLTETLKNEVSRLASLGATIVDDSPKGGAATVGLGRVVMADPEGNTFSVWSSDAETKAVTDALDAGIEPDLSGSYFANAPLDPEAVTVAHAIVERQPPDHGA